jgi:hypothetical protein
MSWKVLENTAPELAAYGLQRFEDGRYALHSAVSDSQGSSGEFIVTGSAALIDDPSRRSLAVQLASYTVADRYILFELSVDSAASTVYKDGHPIRQHWRRGAGQPGASPPPGR